MLFRIKSVLVEGSSTELECSGALVEELDLPTVPCIKDVFGKGWRVSLLVI